MKSGAENDEQFEKVGECLYRYKPTGKYYARIKKSGKEIRRSLRTMDRAHAKRLLADLKSELGMINQDEGKTSLAGLAGRYAQTILHQKPKTLATKNRVIRRVKEDWPDGSDILVSKVNPSQIRIWLSQYKFGVASYNAHLECLRAMLQVAVDDKIIVHSPVSGIIGRKRLKPVRDTPSNEEFQSIIQDIRRQKFNPHSTESADFLEFLGLVGVGQAEASSLKVGDINWKKKQITAFRQKTGIGYMIPIYPQVEELLRRLTGNRKPEDRVFEICDAKKALAGACARLNLRIYSQRALRRMFITRAIEKGVDVKVIAEWQGHKDGGKLILDTYSHVNRTHANRMAELMA